MSSRSGRACLSQLIGQERVKENLGILIRGGHGRSEALDHVLFYGPPGLGKTTLAHILSHEMGVNLRSHLRPGHRARRGPGGASSPTCEPQDVLFIDEIHRLGRAVEEMLYPAMEDFALDIMIGKGPERALDPAAAAAVHHRRRHNPPGAALGAPASALRRRLSPGFLRSAVDGGDRRPRRRRPRTCTIDAGGVDEIARRAPRHATRRPAPAAPRARLRRGACPTARPSTGRWRATPWPCSISTPLGNRSPVLSMGDIIMSPMS